MTASSRASAFVSARSLARLVPSPSLYDPDSSLSGGGD
jgi:hypothetical protein